METISLKCAGCGAPIQAAANDDVVTCEYCHNQLVIRRPQEESPPIDATLADPPKPSQSAYTEVVDVVRSGATIATSAVEVVDKVSNVLFWTKAALLGGLVILILGCCGIPSYLVYSLFSNNESVQDTISTTSDNVREMVDGERSETRATRASITNVTDKVEAAVRQRGRKLAAEDGQAIASVAADGWQRPLRYDELKGDDYALRSSGVDGVFDTEDDIVETRSIASVIEFMEVPAPVDMEEAQAYLASRGQSRVKAAMQWLGTVSADGYDAEVRGQITRQIIPLTDEHRIAQVARPALFQWCRAEDEALLRERLQQTTRRETASALSAAMVKLDLKASLVSCLNHRIPFIREQIDRDVALMDVPPMMIIDQCITDMQDDRKQMYAVTMLAKQEIPHSQRAAIAEKLLPIVREFRAGPQRNEFLDTIEKLGEHGHPLLIAGLDSPVLKTGERLQKIGPAIEDDVIELIGSSSSITRRNAIEVLAAIGTQKSIEPLGQLAERSAAMRPSVGNAIQQIESRLSDSPQ